MDLRNWIRLQHLAAHGVMDVQLATIQRELLAKRPDATTNSPAWLLWHATRCEDLAVNAIVRGEPQVIADDQWSSRGLGHGRIGTGFADDEVAAFSAAVDLDALFAYRAAVRAETAAWIGTGDLSHLDAKPDLDARLSAAGDLWPDGGSWPREMWSTWPAALFLHITAFGHTMLHAGEMGAVAARLGIRGR